MKIIKVIFFLVAIFAISKIWIANSSHEENLELSNTKKDELKDLVPISLTFVGDIMMDRGVKRSIEKNFADDYDSLFVNASYLKESDITFANLEGSVAYGGHNVGSRFSFHMDPISLKALKNSGIDIVSFANNHVGDWSRVAFTESLKHISENKVYYAGAGLSYSDVTNPTIIDVRGKKIGFLASTDVGPDWLAAKGENPGVLLSSDPNLSHIILEAKKKVDYLVVSYHWGNEYSPANTHQISLAHMSIDNGADIVVGHHPHVMQKIEIYKDKPIFYSLGNFIFDQYFSAHTMRGMVANVIIDPQTKKLTSEVKVSPLSKQYIPQTLVSFDEGMLVSKAFTP